jgi:hypothetical protein
MAIYKELTFYDFAEEFKRYNRENQFTREGLSALYDYLDQEHEFEYLLDVIGLCVEFTEYQSFEEFLKDYDGIETLEDLQDETLTIETPSGGLIIQNF